MLVIAVKNEENVQFSVKIISVNPVRKKYERDI